METIRSFTPVRTPSPDGTVRIHIVFNHPVENSIDDPAQTGYGVEFTYTLRHDNTIEPRPIASTLLTPNGVTASELARFAWTRWERLAEVHARLGQQFNLDIRDEYNHEFASIETQLGLRKASRPGRKGHPHDFYQRVAMEYRCLYGDNPSNPTAALAELHQVARSTAAGWIHTARERGILAPARKGRAG